MELWLALDNIRSTYNVGAILRTADGFGVAKAIFSGYTPRVDDMRVLPHLRDKLNKQIAKTALGAERYVNFYASDDIKSELEKLKDDGFSVVGLENNIEDTRLISLVPENYERIRRALGDKVVLVLGEEMKGIDYSLYDIFDMFLEILMEGKKESFNVSVATGIAVYALKNLEHQKA